MFCLNLFFHLCINLAYQWVYLLSIFSFYSMLVPSLHDECISGRRTGIPKNPVHLLLFWEFVFCCYLIKLEKTEVAIKNGQSRDIGNIWHIRKRTKTSKTHCFMHVISSRTYILNWLLGVRLIFKAYPIPTIIISGLFVETINNLRWIINWLSWHKCNLLCVHLRSKCNCIVIHIQI